MVVRIDVTKAVFPRMDAVLEEILSISAHAAFREQCELMGSLTIPAWADLDDRVKIALGAACRAVYAEIAVAGGATKVPGPSAKKKR